MRAHAAGKVLSTAGGQPKLIWRSAPLSTRDRATRFEAALKSWRDNGRAEFRATTGYDASPFIRYAFTPYDEQEARNGGSGVLVFVIGLVIAIAALAILLGGNS